MDRSVQYSFSFSGRLAEEGIIDFYDIAEAMSGFQRSLALTAHFVVNGKVITQAPALKNVVIYAEIPQLGSWKVITFIGILGTGIWHLGTAPKDTVLGNLIVSAYDYVLKESLGINVNFDKTIGQQLEELKSRDINPPRITEDRLDSVIEKCEASIVSMHRPIVRSGTAEKGLIRYETSDRKTGGENIDSETYNYIRTSTKSDRAQYFYGKISSYNVNTYHGRIYDFRHERTIPFEIEASARSINFISLITASLNANALDRKDESSYVILHAFTISSQNDRIKKLIVINIARPSRNEISSILDGKDDETN